MAGKRKIEEYWGGLKGILNCSTASTLSEEESDPPPFEPALRRILVLKVELKDDRQKAKALTALARINGTESIASNGGDKLTVIGFFEPLDVATRLRKLVANVQIVSVGPIKEEPGKEEDEDESCATPPYEFTFGFLNRITNNFSQDRLIGRGGHGVVYKGVHDNGECISVKRLHPMPRVDNEEFKNEFNHLMRVQHQNTIRLVGYCHHTEQVPVRHNGRHVSARVEERALCFEYLQGGSLEKHLSNEPCALDWHICYEIIRGICEGLHYLHKGLEYPIYHLELKPTKILLDKDMIPKIGGFGFSGLSDSIETSDTSEVLGTSVYMPPEYTSKRQITHKFDVFSLGVIILQIMAGKGGYSKHADIPPEEFIESVYEFWANKMQATIPKHTSCQVRTCIEIALKCLESNRENRPTIKEIIQRLNKIGIVECSSIGQLYRTREFAFEFLQRITNDFSEKNMVGHGGYGAIYKGVLDNGEEIVVKKLHQTTLINDEQFKNEITNLMRVHHENIVQLIGYCHHSSPTFVEYNGKHVSASIVERAICLEYMAGGSLEKHLSAESCKLDWEKCYIIIKGICEGLHCLHNAVAPIYHLDLKPSNILLDNDMVAKIGDFGLSRLFDSTQTYMTASKDMKGTLGYMPPEYIKGQKISSKFDVFSLGVIIIQIMAGRDGYFNFQHNHAKEFIKHVFENWRVRMQATMWSHVSEEVRTCIEIALKCVEEDRNRRPKMAQIVNKLNNIGIAQSSPIEQNEIENKASTEDGEEPNSMIEAVADVLAEDTKTPMFLQRVGIQHVGGGSSGSKLEADLTAEKRANAELREVIDTLSRQVKDLEEARIRQDEENRKKKQAEMQT